MKPASRARDSLESPALDGYDVTPHNTNEIGTVFPKALWVGTGGDVEVVTVSNTTLLFKNVPDGSVLPIRPVVVRAANTTASDIIALV